MSGFFKTIRNFLFIFIFAAGLFFLNPCRTQASTEEEYKAQKKFLQLQSSVDNEDYIRAQLVLSSFKRDFSKTKFYKEYSKRINDLDKKIKKEFKKIKVEDKIEYLFIPPRLETKQWKEYMSAAEKIVSQSNGETGIAVLRVIFEDESLERLSAVTDFDVSDQLIIFQKYGGFSNGGNYQSGEPVFVGSWFRRCRASDSNDKNVSMIGGIKIEGIYHYPTRLKIEMQKGKAVAFGEILVRTIPKEYCGNLMVNVEAEKGLQLADAAVSLKVSGFYSGKILPLKEGSCLFSSIGPGTYIAGLASNNIFESPGQSAVVSIGQTSEVTIKAYRRRMIEFDWRFHRTDGPYNWITGHKIMKTDDYWQPDKEWPDVHYPVIDFGGWTGDTCKIRTSNGDLMSVDTNEPFAKMDFPLNFVPFSRDWPIKEGDIFAWQREDREQKGNFFQALICIRKITPVGLPQDQNSSVQEKNSD
jgi:hypothetical protein